MVYRAADPHLERYVAIKVLKMHLVSGPTTTFLQRFEREAHLLAHLQHPNIVPIIDYGILPNHSPYLVMPFLTGGALKACTGRPMPYTEAARLLAPVADALAYAHRVGIIHRDIKPANILLTESWRPNAG